MENSTERGIKQIEFDPYPEMNFDLTRQPSLGRLMGSSVFGGPPSSRYPSLNYHNNSIFTVSKHFPNSNSKKDFGGVGGSFVPQDIDIEDVDASLPAHLAAYSANSRSIRASDGIGQAGGYLSL